MSLPAGTRLGPYEIVSPLGAGGMGEVFRARDTRLDRVVAIKTLRQEVAEDPDRRARFEREARVVASITHPHICTLYDVGHARVTIGSQADQDVAFLVMELLEGETLDHRLLRGALPLADALTCAMQMADALDRAHRQGIVHRDLKPSNIMLTAVGAKLLDFGLAQLRHEPDQGIGGATQTGALTAQGTILGTLQYIAPEQLEGRAVDSRADLFAFGAILHEMATGQRAFAATSQAALVSAVLHRHPPPLTTINPALPVALERVVTGCLAKDPDDRWGSAHDLRLMLKGVADEPAFHPAPVAARQSRRREWIAWAVALVAVAAAGMLVARVMLRGGDASLDVVSVLPADTTSLTPGEAPQVSPDGRHVAFTATDETGKTVLYVRDLESVSVRTLAGTDDATQPFWSPDSRSIGFFAAGRLKRTAASGGALQDLAAAPVPRGGSWSRDDLIVFVPHPGQPPRRVAAAGGADSPVPGPEGRWFPTFLPDGHHFVYLAIEGNRVGSMLRVASVDSSETKDLVPSKSSAVYAPPGYVVFRRDESLVAQRLDLDRLEARGPPIVLIEKVAFNPITYQTQASVSFGGVLAYLEPGGGGQLVWFDRLGRRLAVATPPGGYNSLCFCANGSRVVYDSADAASGTVDIWSMDVTSGTRSRLTFDPSIDFYVACSPSSDDVVFASLRQGLPGLYRLNTTAPGSEHVLLHTAAVNIPTDWSRDGKWIFYSTFTPKTSWDIWVQPLPGGDPTPVAVTDAEERNARLSPDGQWMAYTSNQGGAVEVYVQPFPATGTRWQVSSGGGRQAVWSPDGHQLFYISPEKKIVAVDVSSSTGKFATGASRTLVDTRVAGWERTNQGSPYAMTPDGERFLVSTAADTVRPITVMFNWPMLLDRTNH